MVEVLRVHAGVFRGAATSAMADLRAIYTWRTWLSAWMVRVLAQVTFFGLIGVLLGDPERVAYLVVGSAVMIVAMEAMLTVASTQWERWQGTMPLLVSAPVNFATVYVGRSVQWIVSGTASATVAFYACTLLFGVPLPMPEALLVPLLIATTGVGTYGFACLVGALVLRWPESRNVVSNTATMGMMAICGVIVPVEYWPAAVQALASALPLTHGVEAVRVLLAGGSVAEVARQAGWALMAGAAWVTAAIVAIRRFAERGRQDGSIEFGG